MLNSYNIQSVAQIIANMANSKLVSTNNINFNYYYSLYGDKALYGWFDSFHFDGLTKKYGNFSVAVLYTSGHPIDQELTLPVKTAIFDLFNFGNLQ